MFPIPWNKAYRKKDGGLTIIDDMFVDAPELQEEIDALDERADGLDDRITDLETIITLSLDVNTGFTFGGTLRKVGKIYILTGRCTCDSEITTSVVNFADVPLTALPDNDVFSPIVTLNSTGQTGVAYIVKDTQTIKLALNAALPATKPFYINMIWAK